MICKKCGETVPDGLFCVLCGFRQDKVKNTRHRGNGQGTAYKRGKTWTGQRAGYSYVQDGKLVRRRPTKGGFATKRDALQWANQPEIPDAPAPRLIDLWQGWSENDMLNLSPNKQTAYRIARKRLEPIIGRRIDNLTLDDLQSCVNSACSTFYPAHDVKCLLSHLYQRAMASNVQTQNLALYLVLPKLDEKEAQPFRDDEVKALWAGFEQDVFIGYILLLIYTGMMPAELMACRKSMIDLDACEIRGAGAKTKVRKKSAIVFPEFLRPVVEELLAYSSGEKLLTMNKDNFYGKYYAALERCGVRRLPPYSCRHTFGTEIVKAGLHPSVVQRLLRHSNQQTQEKYTHLADDFVHDAAERVWLTSG